MKLTLEVINATVLRTDGTDKIVINFKEASPYPDWLPNMIPFVTIEVARGYGVEYAKKLLGFEPELIG